MQSATVGAIEGESLVHRRARSAVVVLQWRAVHRHGARRARDGCARHRSGRQLLPSTTTTAGDDAAAGARRHALAEAVLASPAAAVRLVGTLHDLSLWGAPARGPDTDISSSSTRHTTTASRSTTYGGRPRTVTMSRSYRAGRPLNARGPAGTPQRRSDDAVGPLLPTPSTTPAIVHMSSPGQRDLGPEPGDNPRKYASDLPFHCPQLIH